MHNGSLASGCVTGANCLPRKRVMAWYSVSKEHRTTYLRRNALTEPENAATHGSMTPTAQLQVDDDLVLIGDSVVAARSHVVNMAALKEREVGAAEAVPHTGCSVSRSISPAKDKYLLRLAEVGRRSAAASPNGQEDAPAIDAEPIDIDKTQPRALLVPRCHCPCRPPHGSARTRQGA